MRLDESTWQLIHQGTHIKTDPYERVPVALNFPTSRLIVSLNLLDLTKDWVRGGYAYQFWSRGLDQILVARRFLFLNQPTVIQVEPLQASNLFIEPLHYISEFGLTVEARVEQ
jgi:hypothetical protein